MRFVKKTDDFRLNSAIRFYALCLSLPPSLHRVRLLFFALKTFAVVHVADISLSATRFIDCNFRIFISPCHSHLLVANKKCSETLTLKQSEKKDDIKIPTAQMGDKIRRRRKKKWYKLYLPSTNLVEMVGMTFLFFFNAVLCIFTTSKKKGISY